jgi:hypothetical protein
VSRSLGALSKYTLIASPSSINLSTTKKTVTFTAKKQVGSTEVEIDFSKADNKYQIVVVGDEINNSGLSFVDGKYTYSPTAIESKEFALRLQKDTGEYIILTQCTVTSLQNGTSPYEILLSQDTAVITRLANGSF